MTSKINLEQSHTLLCYQELKYHPHWRLYSFKKLDCDYPPYKAPLGIITEVEVNQFREKEEFVLPFFVATQFGIFPKVKEVYGDIEELGLIAILKKSMLSGCVAGLSIGIWNEGEFREVEFFKN